MKHYVALLFAFIVYAAEVSAQPTTISFQGVLRDGAGAAVADGNYTMVFRIFDVATGGTALWTETQTVAVSNGMYNVQLGSVTNFGSLVFDRQYWIGVTVSGTEMTPRFALTAAPYAMGFRGSSNVFGGGGNVGIGTLTPQDRLDLGTDGNIRFTSSNWAMGGARFNSSISGASSSSDFYMQRGGNTSWRDYLIAHVGNTSGSGFGVFTANATPRLTVDGSSGETWARNKFSVGDYNSGTDTDNPYDFSVTKNGFANATLKIASLNYNFNSGTSAAPAATLFLGARNNFGTAIKAMNPGNSTWVDYMRLGLFTQTAPNNTTMTERVSIMPHTGNVGIGTTAPNAKLDVDGAIFVKGEAPFKYQVFSCGRAWELDYNTNIDANEWVGIIAGYNITSLGIDEFGWDEVLRLYAAPAGDGKIHIYGKMPTTNTTVTNEQPLWSVDLLLIRKPLITGR